MGGIIADINERLAQEALKEMSKDKKITKEQFVGAKKLYKLLKDKGIFCE